MDGPGTIGVGVHDPGDGNGDPAHNHDSAPGAACQASFDAVVAAQPDLMVGGVPALVALPRSSPFPARFDPPKAPARAASWSQAAGPPLYLRFAHLLI